MPKGIVKWFNSEKGFGFVQPEDGSADVFVHISAVQQAGLETLGEGDRIDYGLKTNNRGQVGAANIRLLDKGAGKSGPNPRERSPYNPRERDQRGPRDRSRGADAARLERAPAARPQTSAPRVRVKVCCISSEQEADLAIKAGADALGLVVGMPSGPGVITEGMAARLAPLVPPPVASVLLTAQTRAEHIAEEVLRTGVNTVQIVNHVDTSEHVRLRAQLPPSVRIIQVVHVEGPDALDLVSAYAPRVDAFLLDSGRPGSAVPELGGTARTHDWSISARIVRGAGKPVFLAGGLTPDNVAQAIATVRPYGVDLCSGVRTDGALDRSKLFAFMAAVRG